MKLLLISIFIASFGTAIVAFVNFANKGIAAFANGPWMYIGYFVVIALVVFVMSLLMEKVSGK